MIILAVYAGCLTRPDSATRVRIASTPAMAHGIMESLCPEWCLFYVTEVCDQGGIWFHVGHSVNIQQNPYERWCLVSRRGQHEFKK